MINLQRGAHTAKNCCQLTSITLNDKFLANRFEHVYSGISLDM